MSTAANLLAQIPCVMLLLGEVIYMSSNEIVSGLTAESLVAKWKRNPDSEQWQNPFNLRMRRATSWLARAEQEQDDPDAAFIFYWIAFNAAYAQHSRGLYDGEQAMFGDYFNKVAGLDNDTNRAIYNAVWMKHNREVRTLLDNEFVFKPFWQNAINWRQRFDDSKRGIEMSLRERNTRDILVTLFDRLYVLRNQLLHGGSTWQGSVNRSQVLDGAAIMAFLVPHFIDLMLDNPTVDWGIPAYAAGTILLPPVK